jgi:hypothetical protein
MFGDTETHQERNSAAPETKEAGKDVVHTSPASITLHGHRLSSLYRADILQLSSSCFKYSGERERLASRWRAA